VDRPRKPRGIPATVLAEAKKATAAAKPRPTAAPGTAPRARVKEKVLAALRRLHPMD
jgi:hypothetical protein